MRACRSCTMCKQLGLALRSDRRDPNRKILSGRAFTPELLTVVWVGFDDNQPVGLSGAQAALPISLMRLMAN